MRRLLPTATFVLGIVLGGAAASHVWLVASRALNEAVLAQFIVEQEYLANRAHRDGRALQEAVHRINVADGQAEIGFRWLQRGRNATYREWFTFPWTSYWLLQRTDMHPETERFQRGRQLVEAQYRAQAAIALERLNLLDAAEAQWSTALKLQPSWSIERYRKFESDRGPSTIAPDVESAYLESTSWAELEASLARIRSDLGIE
jgi:hypothetical protein